MTRCIFIALAFTLLGLIYAWLLPNGPGRDARSSPDPRMGFEDGPMITSYFPEIPGLEQQDGEERDQFGLLPFRPTPLRDRDRQAFDYWWNSGDVLLWRKNTGVQNPYDSTFDYIGAFRAGLTPVPVPDAETGEVHLRWRSIAGARWLKSKIHPTRYISEAFEQHRLACIKENQKSVALCEKEAEAAIQELVETESTKSSDYPEIAGLEQQEGEARDEFGLLPFRLTPLQEEEGPAFEYWWNHGEVLAWRKEKGVQDPHDRTYDVVGAFKARVQPKSIPDPKTGEIQRRWPSVAGRRWLKSKTHATRHIAEEFESQRLACHKARGKEINICRKATELAVRKLLDLESESSP